MRRCSLSITVVSLAVLAVSCTDSGGGPDTPNDKASKPTRARQDSPSAPAESPSAPPAPKSVAANELGAVPVLMYHQIIPNPQGVYDRTPKDFRAELERLAREKYVPVTAAEYSTGKMDLPAGTHPVVLTFDDSSDSQLRLGPDGEPTDDCAVGILHEVAARHEGFRPVATFFVNGDAFSATGSDKALAWLHEHGHEIGNHTFSHVNFSALSATEVQREITADQKAITKYAPGAQVVSIGLPFGIQPDPPGLALAGRHNGGSYKHHGAYLVGSNPAPSPYAASFDPAGIPRVRSAGPNAKDAQFGSSHWLDKLADDNPARYTSDGDPERISYPKDSSAEPAREYGERAQPY